MNPKTTTVVEGMKFVIMLAFGHPKGDQLRHDLKSFKTENPPALAGYDYIGSVTL